MERGDQRRRNCSSAEVSAPRWEKSADRKGLSLAIILYPYLRYYPSRCWVWAALHVAAKTALLRYLLALKFRYHGSNGLFRIAEEHARVIAEEQRVINTREA